MIKRKLFMRVGEKMDDVECLGWGFHMGAHDASGCPGEQGLKGAGQPLGRALPM